MNQPTLNLTHCVLCRQPCRRAGGTYLSKCCGGVMYDPKQPALVIR